VGLILEIISKIPSTPPPSAREALIGIIIITTTIIIMTMTPSSIPAGISSTTIIIISTPYAKLTIPTPLRTSTMTDWKISFTVQSNRLSPPPSLTPIVQDTA
jgi:hypothetical protein